MDHFTSTGLLSLIVVRATAARTKLQKMRQVTNRSFTTYRSPYLIVIFNSIVITSSWLDGAHPTVEYGEVSRTVCLSDRPTGCKYLIKISVKNCGSFSSTKFLSPLVVFPATAAQTKSESNNFTK